MRTHVLLAIVKIGLVLAGMADEAEGGFLSSPCPQKTAPAAAPCKCGTVKSCACGEVKSCACPPVVEAPPPAQSTMRFAMQEIGKFHKRFDALDAEVIQLAADLRAGCDTMQERADTLAADVDAAKQHLGRLRAEFEDRSAGLLAGVIAAVVISALVLLLQMLSMARAGKCLGLVMLLAVGPAQANPAAAWRVAISDGQMTAYGSATAVAAHYLLTNAHVVEGSSGQAVIYQPHTGARLGARIVGVDRAEDLALLYVADELAHVKIAAAPPQSGEACVVYGFGMQGVLRRGEGTVAVSNLMRESGSRQYETDVCIESGDSGSGVLNAAGELVAVNWGNEAGDTPSPSICVPLEAVQRFVIGYETQCGDGGCISGGVWGGPCRPQWGGGRRGGQMQPVAPSPPRPQPPPQAPPAAPPAAQAPGCACDNDALAARLKALEERDQKMTEILEKLAGTVGTPGQTGPAGPAGPQGPAGRDCDPAKLAAIEKQLAEIKQQLAGLNQKPSPSDQTPGAGSAAPPVSYDIVPRSTAR